MALKARKENAPLKIKKIINEYHIVAIEEHIRIFLLGLACKKKCIGCSRRRRISMFGAFSFSAK
jgi:hypothetical protein